MSKKPRKNVFAVKDIYAVKNYFGAKDIYAVKIILA